MTEGEIRHHNRDDKPATSSQKVVAVGYSVTISCFKQMHHCMTLKFGAVMCVQMNQSGRTIISDDRHQQHDGCQVQVWRVSVYVGMKKIQCQRTFEQLSAHLQSACCLRQVAQCCPSDVYTSESPLLNYVLFSSAQFTRMLLN